MMDGVTPCELWPRGRLRQHDDDDIPPFSSPHYRYFWIQRILSSPLFLLDLLQLPSLSHRRVAAESLPLRSMTTIAAAVAVSIQYHFEIIAITGRG